MMYEVIRWNEIHMQLKEWDMENEGENRAQGKRVGCFDKQL